VLEDIGFESFGFNDLRISVVHNFVKELINDSKVVDDGLWAHIDEIIAEKLLQGLEENEMRGDVAIGAANNKKVEGGSKEIGKTPLVDPENWRRGTAVVRLNVAHEFVRNREVNIAPVIKTDQNPSVVVEDVDGGHRDYPGFKN
jgi:hypothetical protein